MITPLVPPSKRLQPTAPDESVSASAECQKPVRLRLAATLRMAVRSFSKRGGRPPRRVVPLARP